MHISCSGVDALYCSVAELSLLRSRLTTSFVYCKENCQCSRKVMNLNIWYASERLLKIKLCKSMKAFMESQGRVIYDTGPVSVLLICSAKYKKTNPTRPIITARLMITTVSTCPRTRLKNQISKTYKTSIGSEQ